MFPRIAFLAASLIPAFATAQGFSPAQISQNVEANILGLFGQFSPGKNETKFFAGKQGDTHDGRTGKEGVLGLSYTQSNKQISVQIASLDGGADSLSNFAFGAHTAYTAYRSLVNGFHVGFLVQVASYPPVPKTLTVQAHRNRISVTLKTDLLRPDIPQRLVCNFANPPQAYMTE